MKFLLAVAAASFAAGVGAAFLFMNADNNTRMLMLFAAGSGLALWYWFAKQKENFTPDDNAVKSDEPIQPDVPDPTFLDAHGEGNRAFSVSMRPAVPSRKN